jgi:hypothetical protein
MNVRKGFNRIVNAKVDYIVKICEELELEFDNTIPNKYTIISKKHKYVFSTYGDVISALGLLKNDSK